MLTAILSSKLTLVVLTIIGMAICTGGIGRVAERGAWLNPFSIAGYVLGAVILLIVGAGLFGFKLPLIDSTRAALIAVIILAIVKVALTQVHRSLA